MTLGKDSYEAIDKFARSRVGRGDLYGWAVGPGEESATLLVRRGSNARDFPVEIHGIRIELREIAEPKRQAVREPRAAVRNFRKAS